jgi:hypothetical protein
MRMISLLVVFSFALLPSVTLAQQPPATAGESIGEPPPIPSPPPLPGPPPETGSSPATKPAATPSPAVNAPAPKGYTGAYAPPGTPPTPYSTGPLPSASTGPGLNTVGPDGSTKTVKAVPCSTVARETDGFTTCIGISDQSRREKKR